MGLLAVPRYALLSGVVALTLAGCDASGAVGVDAAATSDAGVPSLDAAGLPQSCTYFSDPENGSVSNTGTSDSPWSSLETVLAAGLPIRGGDVLCLRQGDHGAPRVQGMNFSTELTFVAVVGETPRVSELRIEQSSKLVFDGLVVDGSKTIDPGVDEKEQFLVAGDATTHHIVFRNMTIQSADSSATWTRADWYNKSKSGIDMRGAYIAVERSRMLNLYHALSLRGDHSYAGHNLVDNFAGDAIRGLGSFSTYEFNVVRDAYVNDYDIQHDDLFQAYDLSADPKIESVVIRNNRLVQFLDPISAFVADNDLMSRDLQGIIITDGYADGWVVENNLVVTNHPHGITLYGARHCRVQNNTVTQPPYHTDDEVPWIRLTDQSKTGHPNFDNVVRNNLATKLTTWEYDDSSLIEHNTDIDELDPDDYRRHFLDYDGQDYHLSMTSPAVNVGTNQDTSEVDLDGNPRIRAGTVDTGAYEYSQGE